MTSKDIKKQLSTYTKEEIIKAIIATPYVNYKILNYLDAMRTASENKEINKASDAWKAATDAYLQYSNKLVKQYGNINILNLPAEARDKLLKLKEKEKILWKKLTYLQDKQAKRFLEAAND